MMPSRRAAGMPAAVTKVQFMGDLLLSKPFAGKLIILSGPSGVGKTTVVRKLLASCPLPLALSVSATTRQPRPGEVDGVAYHFLSKGEFTRRHEAGEFLEACEVFGRGHWYGTLREEVQAGWKLGRWMILEIDVQGAMKVLQQVAATTIFLCPGSVDELELRLRGRETETEERIQERLAAARHELSFAHRYQHRVVNDSVDRAAEEICAILQSLNSQSPLDPSDSLV